MFAQRSESAHLGSWRQPKNDEPSTKGRADAAVNGRLCSAEPERVATAEEDQQRSPAVVENPLSGERITILRRDTGRGGASLVWELVLAPGGQVPSSHAHPHQQERFTVLRGELEFRLGWRRLHVAEGGSVTVPPGRVHHFANRSGVPSRVLVETVPALQMEGLLRTAACGCREPRPPSSGDHPVFVDEAAQTIGSS